MCVYYGIFPNRLCKQVIEVDEIIFINVFFDRFWNLFSIIIMSLGEVEIISSPRIFLCIVYRVSNKFDKMLGELDTLRI